jgi:uncharacterized protein YjdB
MYYAPRMHGLAARDSRNFPFGFLLALASLIVAGCDASPAAVVAEEAPASIQLSRSAVEFATADTTRLEAVLLGASGRPIASPSAGQPKSASPAGVRWQSSDRRVVEVSRSGLLQARESGEAIVTASSGNLRAQAQVEVRGSQRAVVVSPKVDTLTHLGEISQLTAALFNDDGRRVGGNVSWASSNPQVVTVDKKGTLTALAVGVALVTATASSSADTARIVVRQEPAIVLVSPRSVTADVGESTTFRASVADAGGTEISNVPLSWTSSDTKVATVDSKGVVSAKAAGTAIIRAAAEDASGSGDYTVQGTTTDTSLPPPSSPPPSGGSSQDHPNQPSGFQVITDQPWDLPPWHRDNSWNGRDDTSLTIVEDSRAPRSARRVARAETFEGMDGVGTHSTSYYFTSEQRTQELYFAVWQMFPSNWINHRVGTKQLWPGIHGHPNSVYSSFANQEMRIQVNLQGQAWGNRNLNPNLGPSSHHNLERWRDQWYRLEFYLKMNTVNDRNGDQSRANGIVRVWMTAGGETHLVLNYEDVKFLAIDRDGKYVPSYGSTSDGTFHTFKWNPTYGGTGDPAPAVMYNYTDHIYVSGAR